MLDQTIVTFCICDEVTKALNLNNGDQCKMSSSEVMTFAILSATMHGGNYKTTLVVANHFKLFTRPLSHSRLVRRIHQIPDEAWMMVFQALQCFLKSPDQNTFIVDSFPVKAFENHKSFRSRIFSDKVFHGYTASKKQYFFGIKVHMVVDLDGIPIEFLITPGSVADIKALKAMPLELPSNAVILGDRAYTDYQFEDLLIEMEKIKLLPKRKVNHKRQHSLMDENLLKTKRNYIETVFSCITEKMPRCIRARTERGFILKVHFFILAYMVGRFHPLG